MNHELRARTKRNMQRFNVPKGFDAVQIMDALPCKCGHAWNRHDPEDGECDAPSAVDLGKCRCEAFRSPDPDLTLREYVAAILAPDLPEGTP